MKCPRERANCHKYNTVRHCPGCPLWKQAKEARQARMGMPQPLPTAPQPLPTAPQPLPTASQSAPYALRLAPRPIVYHYDGSLAGFYSCVFESFSMRELPIDIRAGHEIQPTLVEAKDIATDHAKAQRVRASIPVKIAKEALALVETVFLSCLAQKELLTLRFLDLAYREGGKALNMLGHPHVAPLWKADKSLMREVHQLKGFVRFSDYEGILAAAISPKNFVLPFLSGHFSARLAEERFIIYDKTHKACLIYQDHRHKILPFDEMHFPQADENEESYRALWKSFYHTIAIEARINPRLRMTNLPKRYWGEMTEMQELL